MQVSGPGSSPSIRRSLPCKGAMRDARRRRKNGIKSGRMLDQMQAPAWPALTGTVPRSAAVHRSVARCHWPGRIEPIEQRREVEQPADDEMGDRHLGLVDLALHPSLGQQQQPAGDQRAACRQQLGLFQRS